MFLLRIVISVLLPALQDALDIPHAAAASVVRPVDGLKQGILAIVAQAVGETFQICRTRYRPDALLVDLDYLTEGLVLGWYCSRRDMFTVYTVYVGFKICTLGALYGFIFCTLRVQILYPCVSYGFIFCTLGALYGFVFQPHGIVSIELWEMIPHLFLVAWVDGLDEALFFQRPSCTDDCHLALDASLAHDLRIGYLEPVRPFELIRYEEQAKVHRLFPCIQNAHPPHTKCVQLLDIIHRAPPGLTDSDCLPHSGSRQSLDRRASLLPAAPCHSRRRWFRTPSHSGRRGCRPSFRCSA